MLRTSLNNKLVLENHQIIFLLIITVGSRSSLSQTETLKFAVFV
ncbi:hypothetical protein EYZ11_009037 [Aspergillus tanneri]|uniref:Uncharacterized protein n=1 Tax=Aspergillus tanneri TaxID=1220188 RepID=A0A4S3J914_9EURO|nr:hypothetical protein EYZ11_009037 [Aspergillus tanneri]